LFQFLIQFLIVFKSFVAISLATDYTFPQAEKLKNLLSDPVALAAAAAAASASAAPVETKEEKKKLKKKKMKNLKKKLMFKWEVFLEMMMDIK